MLDTYKTKKKFFIFGILFISLLFVYIILINFLEQNSYSKKIKSLGLENLTVEEIVMGLDSKQISIPNLSASITGSKLILKNNEKNIEIFLPDKFYLSFAPYIETTHPCFNHNLITCKGELANEIFVVKIISDKEEVLYNESIKSMDNGFIGVWLPKNITGKLIINYQVMQAESIITTYETSNTCLTTPLQLKQN